MHEQFFVDFAHKSSSLFYVDVYAHYAEYMVVALSDKGLSTTDVNGLQRQQKLIVFCFQNIFCS